ncbi:hypothetical protein ACFLIN_05000 [Corynebacterium kutscheri]|uniref:Uncharacterized protein n=1 Tax=Corynebacterium kutscheri TaxID=35755 RepID=A0A0F6R099_9CORY|nr:hypothetical protein [Corynebacterium kutscheri]AKE40308.1 hypothetical protein UL82_00325 [Corynebacterium kutscheri]VEH05468.1 Uncharacterised protein [Corynebacterium kutscheri]VEH10701.1 Uncharacterised protein [Corynebacterium kutscheri]
MVNLKKYRAKPAVKNFYAAVFILIALALLALPMVPATTLPPRQTNIQEVAFISQDKSIVVPIHDENDLPVLCDKQIALGFLDEYDCSGTSVHIGIIESGTDPQRTLARALRGHNQITGVAEFDVYQVDDVYFYSRGAHSRESDSKDLVAITQPQELDNASYTYYFFVSGEYAYDVAALVFHTLGVDPPALTQPQQPAIEDIPDGILDSLKDKEELSA